MKFINFAPSMDAIVLRIQESWCEKMAKKKSSSNFIIRRTDTLGTGDADTESGYQGDYFVDTGGVSLITDSQDPRRIILGRTGSGKTALLKQIKTSEENVIYLPPDTLALRHLSNSNIINFFEKMDVHLDVFYMLLWIHVISVELLKKKYGINSKSQMSMLERAFDQIRRDGGKERAIQYVKKWGDEFWLETERRTKEFTDKLEAELDSAIKAGVPGAAVSTGGKLNATTEEKSEIIKRAQNVINNVQLRDLMTLIDLLSEDIFYDNQRQFFVLIDGLDDDWAPDSIKYRLIKSLIEALRKLHKINNVKVIVGLRTDIFYRILSETKTAGSQEEKYESLIYEIRWTEREIEKLIDKRVELLFKRRFTGQRVKLSEIMPPNQIDRGTAFQYILSRSFMRPREVIQFFNECLSASDGKAKLTVQSIRDAERQYSEKRLRSLYDEWRSNYPNLQDYVGLIERKKASLRIDDFTKDEVEELCCICLQDDGRQHGPMYQWAQKVMDDGRSEWKSFLRRLLYHLYLTGIIGIKVEAYKEVHWSFTDTIALSLPQVNDDCRFEIHPTFWFSLGIITD